MANPTIYFFKYNEKENPLDLLINQGDLIQLKREKGDKINE